MKLIKRLFPDKSPEIQPDVMPRRLSLLDIGARGGTQWPWDHVNPKLLSVMMVEPDLVEAKKLQDAYSTDKTMVLPYVLWREECTLSLNLNRSPGTSSIYLPNRQLLNQFPDAERYDVLETLEVSAVTIDNLASEGRIPQIDFAKIDVQGAELAILEGGCNHLAANLVGLEAEVEFAELYSGQPLFGEVESFVRGKLGLELWDLRKTYWKYEQGRQIPGPIKGRLVFGDALFLRPLSGLEAWLTPLPQHAGKEKVTMLVLTALVYGYVDYAASLLSTTLLDQYFDKPLRQMLQRAVNASGGGLRPFRNGSGSMFGIFDAIARAFKPTYAGWACIGHGLGSRRRGPFWL